MKNIEIEKKFLLSPCSMKRFLRERRIRYAKVPIKQFYIKSDEKSAERYRKIGGRYIHTIKHGSGLRREEIETEVSKKEYMDAKRSASNMIIKTRYRFKLDGYNFELDIFKGALKGLNLLEIEFDSVESAGSFKMPDILNQIVISEVTEDKRFTNGFLSKNMTIPAMDKNIETVLGEIESKNHLKANASIPVEPYFSGGYAVKALLYTLLLSVRANSGAILKSDRDTERLHQLRVAMRKMRAVYVQLEPLFDESWVKERSTVISSLMKETGRKRDLDVYIEKLGTYKKLVDKKFAKGIDKLGEYIESFRETEEKRVLDMLHSEAFESEMNELERFCKDDSCISLSQEAKQPVIFFVKRAMSRRYAIIVKKGSVINSKSSAKKYHKLRIEFKKLRYMMEFFSAMMESESYDYLFPKLKKIQDILGEFQDLQVQSKHLGEFMKDRGIDNNSILKAVEALKEEMQKLENSKKREFREEFVSFSKLENDLRRALCRF